MIFIENKELLEKVSKLSKREISDIFIELLKSKKVNFTELSKMYVEYLETDNKEKQASISTLGLMLASYCMNDTSQIGKVSRQHLYNSGAYGHEDGSTFGKALDEEFLK